ncbi:ATP synthase subunit I [Clostridium sp. E02]|uniref:ATP synthase subunit I n=1 Tax=Clostridium sp. E02 TaxID=2487134 RepID=UPI000F544AAF|nr:ATP synthase subunit I [Clostridium sp. E02]
MEKETKNLFYEVSTGIVVFTVAAMLVAFFVYPKRSVFLGLILGMTLAIVMFLSMSLVLERSMKTEDPNIVRKRGIISSLIRYLLLIAILVFVITRFSNQVDPVAVVIGVFGLKAGAFLQPVIHRIITHKKEEN